MKVRIEIDCTPLEARQFFGLPDMEPINAAGMTELEARVRDNMATITDPERLMKLWFSLGGQSLDQLQKLMAAASQSRSDDKER